MADRLALLPLTGAGERECGECVYLDRSHCDAFDASLPVSAVPWRLPACLDAEREATRLRDVELAARALMDAVDAYHACPGVRHIDRLVGAKNRAEAALRAALKE